MKKYIITIFCIISVIIILSNPQITTKGVISGIKLCLYSVIPALLPFMIISNIMKENDCCKYISNLFYPILSKLFNVSKNGSYAIIMGFTCGFPMGAKTVGDLFIQRKISHSEACYLITFCNNTSITFLLNYIGYSCLKEIIPSKKLILFVYLPPLIVGVLNGLVYKYIQKSVKSIQNIKPLPNNKIMKNPLYESIKSISLLSAYVIFFCIISNYIASIDAFPTYPKALLMCLTEITSGINYVCKALQVTQSSILLILISTIFGGFSITLQSFSFIPTKKMKFFYILGKIQAVIIYLIIFFIRYFFITSL